MHRAADRLPASVMTKIKAVVMFGDPYERLGGLSSQFPYALREKVLQLCAEGDPVSPAPSLPKIGQGESVLPTVLMELARSVTQGRASSII